MTYTILFMGLALLTNTWALSLSDEISTFMNDRQVAHLSQKVLLESIDDEIESLFSRLHEAEASQTNHTFVISKIESIRDDVNAIEEIRTRQSNQLSVLEAFMDERAGYAALHYTDCKLESTGRIFFDRNQQKLHVCNGTAWVAVQRGSNGQPSSYSSSSSSSPSTSAPSDDSGPLTPPPLPSATNCDDITDRAGSGFYDILFDGNVVKVYCDFDNGGGSSYGGDGLTRRSAGLSCTTIKRYWNSTQSGLRWINPTLTPGSQYQIYCDMEAYGGGWNLVYSSRKAYSGYQIMLKGTRHTANITHLDPLDDNNQLAYDVFRAINTSATGYSEVMLSGYRDYNNKGDFITMYFSKDAEKGMGFTQFVEHFGTYWRGDAGCYVGNYIGRESSSGRPISLLWEFRAFSAFAVTSDCNDPREVWNDINNRGGHLLAPAEWDNAEFFYQQTDAGGACRSRGLFHIFIR